MSQGLFSPVTQVEFTPSEGSGRLGDTQGMHPAAPNARTRAVPSITKRETWRFTGTLPGLVKRVLVVNAAELSAESAPFCSA